FLAFTTPSPSTSALTLHDALPILSLVLHFHDAGAGHRRQSCPDVLWVGGCRSRLLPADRLLLPQIERERSVDQGVRDEPGGRLRDRKSTRLNSSHVKTSYAVFCLK